MVHNGEMRRRDPLAELPSTRELQAALARAAEDLYPLAYLALRDSLRAEAILHEVLVLGVEMHWIQKALSPSGELTHQEFREDLFREIWSRAKASVLGGGPGGDLRFSEAQQPFYRLPLEKRAALYLRSRSQLSLAEIQRVLGMSSDEEVFHLIEAARAEVLGRDLAGTSDDDLAGGGYVV